MRSHGDPVDVASVRTQRDDDQAEQAFGTTPPPADDGILGMHLDGVYLITQISADRPDDPDQVLVQYLSGETRAAQVYQCRRICASQMPMPRGLFDEDLWNTDWAAAETIAVRGQNGIVSQALGDALTFHIAWDEPAPARNEVTGLMVAGWGLSREEVILLAESLHYP
jgi:hypothetical protein